MTSGHDRAYVTALKLLARRELAEAQVRMRLSRHQFDDAEIESALEQLRREKALDDRRTALACARTEVRIKHRGRMRVIRRIESLGISREIAREAAAQVFDELDEAALLEQALDRRLRSGQSLSDPAVFRRLHRYLIGQGFDAELVTTTLRRRSRNLAPESP